MTDGTIRKAALKDVEALYRLLEEYGRKGDLLPRPRSQLYDHLRDFWVWEDAGKILGCCALQFSWEDLAEIRSLAVHPDHGGKGIGSALVARAMEEARSHGIPKVFTLTYRPEFFRKLGFHVIDRASLPLKIWSDCIACVKFPDCDENAMIRMLEAASGEDQV